MRNRHRSLCNASVELINLIQLTTAFQREIIYEVLQNYLCTTTI